MVKKVAMGLLATSLWSATKVTAGDQTADEAFSEAEIRVIRPRYFSKTHKWEGTLGLSAIMNQPFVHTLLIAPELSFHFSEMFAIDLAGGYGWSFDKDDKRQLADNFDISTVVLRTQSTLNSKLKWTPIYGKYQLSTGTPIYFDTHVFIGFGATGVNYLYDHCKAKIDVPERIRAKIPDRPNPRVHIYPTALAGVGQRIFTSKKAAANLNLEVHRFRYPVGDGQCDQKNRVNGQNSHDNVMLNFGYSIYF